MSKRFAFCSSIGKWCRKEFHWKNFSLVHHNFHLFVESQWLKGEIGLPYVIYRVVVALSFIVWPALDLWIEGSRYYSSMLYLWLLFATNWSFIILSCSSIVSAINVTRFYAKQQRQIFRSDIAPPPRKTDCLLSFQWLLHTTGANLAIVVSVSFWCFVFAFEGPEFLKCSMSIAKHTANAIYVLVDLFIIATPVRMLHVVYPMTMGVVYSTFHAVYFASGGVGPLGKDYIYDVINWNKDSLSSVLACLFAFTMIAMSQSVLYLVYKIRTSLGRNRDEDEEHFLDDDLSMGDEDGDDTVLESDISARKSTGYQAIN